MKESDRGGAGGVQGFDPWFQRDGEAHGGGVQDSLRQSPTFTADRDDGAGRDGLDRSNGDTLRMVPDIGRHDGAA